MAHQIVWVDIPVLDLDRALSFYASVLGQPIHKQEFPGFAMGVLPSAGGEVSACLYVAESAQPSMHGPLVYLNCDGRLDAALAAVEAYGGEVLEPKRSIAPHGWRAIIRDSEGNRVALHAR